MNRIDEVSRRDLQSLDSEFRRQLNERDADWRRRFDDLDRRLREAKAALERVDHGANSIGDGIMMVLAWAPLWIVLIALAVR